MYSLRVATADVAVEIARADWIEFAPGVTAPGLKEQLASAGRAEQPSVTGVKRSTLRVQSHGVVRRATCGHTRTRWRDSEREVVSLAFQYHGLGAVRSVERHCERTVSLACR